LLVSERPVEKINAELNCSGLRFKTGIFNVSVKSNIPAVARHIRHFYSHYDYKNEADFIDLHVKVNSVGGCRRFYKPQVSFSFDGYEPFVPLPLSQAPAMFEWGLNWCIANTAHHYLIIHSAIIEKDGYGLIMPGTPGSGKSTLCAALVNRGWRLLSDEMALLSLADGLIYPSPRPVSLKNKSINIIKDFASNAVFGDVIPGTLKGDIAHMLPPQSALTEQSTPVKPAFLVFPHYKENAEKKFIELSKARTLMALAEHAFNFNILGEEGFDSMSNMIGRVKCYDFTYADLTTALEGIDGLIK
jgi:HprK-related kinase A